MLQIFFQSSEHTVTFISQIMCVSFHVCWFITLQFYTWNTLIFYWFPKIVIYRQKRLFFRIYIRRPFFYTKCSRNFIFSFTVIFKLLNNVVHHLLNWLIIFLDLLLLIMSEKDSLFIGNVITLHFFLHLTRSFLFWKQIHTFLFKDPVLFLF